MKIAIAGAGIMGRMLAWELLQAGCRPVLYDRDPMESGGAASHTAAGMLAPYAELESADYLIFRMGMASLALWAGLPAKLETDIGFRTGGTLVVSHHQERSELCRFSRHLEQHSHSPGTGTESFRQLDAAALMTLEPQLAETFHEALFLPGEAWVNNRRVMAALEHRLRQAGVTWHQETSVEALAPGLVTVQGKSESFDQVIDCRGLGARVDIPGLRGVRGEVIQIRAPAVKLKHMVRLMHPRYRLYLVPGSDDTYLLGATQIESEDDSPLSVRSGLELLSALYSLHRGFGEAGIIDSRVSCRPALPDNQPLIEHQAGLTRINGLFRHGFLLAPLLAREVASLLTEPGHFHAQFPEIFKSAEHKPPEAEEVLNDQ